MKYLLLICGPEARLNDNSRTEAWARDPDTELWLAADELEEEEL